MEHDILNTDSIDVNSIEQYTDVTSIVSEDISEEDIKAALQFGSELANFDTFSYESVKH